MGNAIATISMFAFVHVFNTRTRIVIIISSRSSTRVRGLVDGCARDREDMEQGSAMATAGELELLTEQVKKNR